jgi:glutaminyl-peptide cyclotransferase
MFDENARGRLGAAAALSTMVLLAACAPADADETVIDEDDPPAGVERLGVTVIEEFPHDPAAFTQGLELRDGVFYESTGLYNLSDVRVVEPGTGAVLDVQPLPDDQFAEGLTLVDDHLWQITWLEGLAHRRDLATLDIVETVEYDGEGWGICYDSERLVMSDGSDTLTFRDPDTFDAVGTVAVTLDGEPLTQINELECVDGQVWANVWMTDEIVRIDPATGEVGAVVDAAGLLTDDEAVGADVLNGIAYAGDDTFYITGKLWPRMFLVQFE